MLVMQSLFFYCPIPTQYFLTLSKDFLKKLLEKNDFEVVIQEEKRKSEEEPQLYSVGVTDMTFNPTTFIFQRRLKTLDGEHIVNQDYWNQNSEDTKPQYWKNSK